MRYEKTPWFSVSVKPVHAGIYEVSGGLPFPYHYWDGKQWLCMAEQRPSDFRISIIKKAGPMPEKTYLDTKKWRGLAQKPEDV